MMENFFVNGYVHGVFDIDAKSEFSQYRFIDCNSDEAENFSIQNDAQEKLNRMHEHISEKYIRALFDDFEMKRNGMWEGVDYGSSKWHNDFTDGDPFTSNFLIYIDSNESGNCIEIRNASDSFKVIPKENEFVWLNQNRKFEHRATHVSGQRRLLSFEFYIPALI
jgi:hypothetical protein